MDSPWSHRTEIRTAETTGKPVTAVQGDLYKIAVMPNAGSDEVCTTRNVQDNHLREVWNGGWTREVKGAF